MFGRYVRLRQVGAQLLPPLELHDHVGAVVLLEHRDDAHDVRVLELDQVTRFTKESLQAPAVQIVSLHGQLRRRTFSGLGDQCTRHVFLDGDLVIEIGISGQVDDAEATAAQYPLDAVPVQHLTLLKQAVPVGGFHHWWDRLAVGGIHGSKKTTDSLVCRALNSGFLTQFSHDNERLGVHAQPVNSIRHQQHLSNC